MAFSFVSLTFVSYFILLPDVNYIIVLLDVVVFAALLLGQGAIKINQAIIFVLLLLFSIVVSLEVKTAFGKLYPLFFILLLTVSTIAIYFSRLDNNKFLNFTNYFFYTYLTLSLTNFFLGYSGGEGKYFDFGYEGHALYGLDGSPASLDAFACLFILINYFYNAGAVRFAHVLVGLITIFFLNTLSALFILIVALLTVFGLMCSLGKKFIFSSYVLLMSVLMFYLGWVAFDEVEVIAITNGRSGIWHGQMIQYVSTLRLDTILFGSTEAMTVVVLWGNKQTNNPHNAYLFMLFRFGVPFLLVSITYFYYRVKEMNNHNFVLFMSLFAAGFSGISVVNLTNPFYMLLGAYLIIKSRHKGNEFSYK